MAAYAGLILRLVNIVEPWKGHHVAPQTLHDEVYEVFWESRLPPHEFLQLMREADRMGLVSPAVQNLWSELTVRWMQRQMQGVHLTGYRDRSQPEDAATLVSSMPAHYLTGGWRGAVRIVNRACCGGAHRRAWGQGGAAAPALLRAPAADAAPHPRSQACWAPSSTWTTPS